MGPLRAGLRGRMSHCTPRPRVPSGEEIVEERGVPVQDDWPIAPDDDKVRFSLSGVTSHSWGDRKRKSNAGGREGGKAGGAGREEGESRRWEVLRSSGSGSGESGMRGRGRLLSPLPSQLPSPGRELLPPRGGATVSRHILPQAQHLPGRDKGCGSGDAGHPAAVTREHPRSPRGYEQLSF